MDVKRYFAPTAREALRALKAELGGEAIVLSNRAVAGGVEILALPPEAIGTLHASSGNQGPGGRDRHCTSRARADGGRGDDHGDDFGDDFHVTLSGLAAGAIPRRFAADAPRNAAGASSPAPRQPPVRPFVHPFSPPRLDAAARAQPERRQPAPDVFAPPPLRDDAPVSEQVVEKMAERVARKVAERDESGERVRALQEANARLMEELSGIRGVIERELAGFSWNETRRAAPARADMLGQLLACGFSSVLAGQLAESVGEDVSPAMAREAVHAALDSRLGVRANDDEIIDGGGIFALVGPTGVGKTTTVAKLAARFVARHGAGRLALITTDDYRIGAQEQLRIYGRILGVPVFAVRDAADLRQTLLELRGKHMVLIDTMGMSQRDHMVMTQAAMLAGAGDVRRLLLINATCRGDTLDDVAEAFAGPDVAGCILTKVDEAVSLAPAVDVAARRGIEVCYVTNGQRVPEDLHLPNRAYLLHRALRPQASESPWRLGGDETGAMLAAQGA
ncbi:MAG: flagellar biosynthesis protein FlhF [Azoarcus sp.]|jgi:flagellar biosynthesis protein FlhF|nr:flagellar biosynthesis protein FlhF [Azoarcus sp.]